ncbi:Protein PCF-11 a [Aphelenchoides avenae]|nr:Protein PCF-11 a [Aphelenchus avenae]
MGNFAFKGAFGGPPIIATINGKRHEIRLCGAPPEVKIEQDPAYELVRHVNIARQSAGPAVPAKEENSKDSLDVKALLKRLQSTGILQKIQDAAKESGSQSGSRQQRGPPSSSARRETASPPIPSTFRIHSLDRRPSPLSSLGSFSMQLLMVRYDSVIDELHQPRIACPHCGIAFDELYGDAYQRHTDWHVQDTLRLRERGIGRSRPWFKTHDDWLNFSEIELVNKTANAGKDGKAGEAAAEATIDASSNEVPTEKKECLVCREKFEEYWDEDAEDWKLRDCVVKDGKVFHRHCVPDADSSVWEDSMHAQASASADVKEALVDTQGSSDSGYTGSLPSEVAQFLSQSP